MANQRKQTTEEGKTSCEGDNGERERPLARPTKRHRVRAKDLEHVLAVAKGAGLTVASIELTPQGTITIRFGEHGNPTEAELDEELRLWRLERDRQDQKQQSKKRR